MNRLQITLTLLGAFLWMVGLACHWGNIRSLRNPRAWNMNSLSESQSYGAKEMLQKARLTR